jgi:hypothetical protein
MPRLNMSCCVLHANGGCWVKTLYPSKIFLFIALFVLGLSIALAVLSIFPVANGDVQSSIIINDQFKLSQNEILRQGLGSFHSGDNISLLVESQTTFSKNFSILTYNGIRYSNFTSSDVAYTFTADADYYEAAFFSNASDAGILRFEVTIKQPKLLFPFSWLTTPCQIMFLLSIGATMFAVLRHMFSKRAKLPQSKLFSSPLSLNGRRRLLALLAVSLAFWLILLAVNSNAFSSFENWYTDHARNPYVSTLFLKDGFLVFNVPLGKLATQDASLYKFVTWPEMPHLYPLGSILLFLPFGELLQNGLDASLVYKLEIALFLFFAHVCLYFFLKPYWKKDIHMMLKLVGVYIIYVSLVIYAADGMFDSVAFMFSLFALTMFIAERFDYFLLLFSISVFLKYQAGIFLLPLLIVGCVILFIKTKISSFLDNKAVIAGVVLLCFSGLTAYLSAPFVVGARAQLIMNGINAFLPNAQISWNLQSFAVLLTLVVTLIYALYMLNKNSLLSLLALFLLLPSFMLPYFQNWYLPFIFVYVLIPQNKKELEATTLWLIFMVAVLSFGGASFNPLQIFNNFRNLVKL